TRVPWGDLCAVWQSQAKADATFVADCRAARAEAKSRCREVMKSGTPTEVKSAKQLLDWLNSDHEPEPDEPALAFPTLENWDPAALAAADDVVRTLCGTDSVRAEALGRLTKTYKDSPEV